MARKKAAKKSRKKIAKPKRDWSAMRRWAFPTLAILSIAALGAGLTIGVDRLDTSARRVLADEPPIIELRSPADLGSENWVRDEDLGILENRIRSILDGTDPMDVRPLGRVSVMLESSGWFRDAPRVERIGQHTVRITGSWRRPAAVVRSGSRDHLISWEAMPMPPVFAPGGSTAPIILNVGMTNIDPDLAARYARPWPGDDVRAALALLKLFAFKPWRKQVAAIDVGGLSRGGPIVLITDLETRIVWGGKPGVFHPGEKGDDEKLARLDHYFQNDGRIDGGYDGIEIQGQTILIRRADPEP